jgi:hypothetical protein
MVTHSLKIKELLLVNTNMDVGCRMTKLFQLVHREQSIPSDSALISQDQPYSIQFSYRVCVWNSDGLQVVVDNIIPLKTGITGTGCQGRATPSGEGPKSSANSAEERT